MNSRYELAAVNQLQEETALHFLSKTEIQDLIFSLDNLSNVELEKVIAASEAVLRERLPRGVIS